MSFHAGVFEQVDLQSALLVEGAVALRALVRSLSRVDADVTLELTRLLEALVAVATHLAEARAVDVAPVLLVTQRLPAGKHNITCTQLQQSEILPGKWKVTLT